METTLPHNGDMNVLAVVGQSSKMGNAGTNNARTLNTSQTEQGNYESCSFWHETRGMDTDRLEEGQEN